MRGSIPPGGNLLVAQMAEHQIVGLTVRVQFPSSNFLIVRVASMNDIDLKTAKIIKELWVVASKEGCSSPEADLLIDELEKKYPEIYYINFSYTHRIST